MNYQKKLWTLRERAWDAARRALDDMLRAGPGTHVWVDAWQRYQGAVEARDVLRVEADRAYDDVRRGL